MTKWQWSVIIALIRVVLVLVKMTISSRLSEQPEDEDISLLNEALERDE